MNRLILLLTFIFAGLPLFAQSSQAAFDEANVYMEKGEITNAMNVYRSIEASGEVSGALFLNMGISSVQLDSMGLAKYYFLKAANFEETEERAIKALEFVNNQFSRQSATLPKLPWDRAVDWINNSPGAFGLFLVGFIILLLGLCLLFVGWFDVGSIQFPRWLIVTLGTAGAILIIGSFYADYVDRRYDEGILVTNSSRVLQSPSDDGTLISIAYEGYAITVDRWKSREANEWLYVRLGNGQYGWMYREGVITL